MITFAFATIIIGFACFVIGFIFGHLFGEEGKREETERADYAVKKAEEWHKKYEELRKH